MRITRVLSTLIVIALPAAAWAQTPASDPAQPAPQAAAQPATETGTGMLGTGSIDFGVRGTSISGDSARYNRYRDLGDGLFLQGFRLEREQNNWLVNGTAVNVGRADQEFEGRVTRPGMLKAWVNYNQTPWLLSNTTRTLYRAVSPNVLVIDDGLQSSLQAAASAARPGILANFIAGNAATFDLTSRRHTGEAGVQYMFDPDTTLSVNISRMNREGTIPIAGTFGFSNAIEIAAPVNHHLTDADVTAERTDGRVLLRVGYSGSFFRNDFTSITWDNPYARTDSTSAPSLGREALPPSNDYHNVNGLVAVTMPRHSRLMGSLSFGVLRDVNADIVPQTINSAIVTAPLERTTVDGSAHTKALNLSFTSTPSRDVSLELRYRYYDFNNLTPVFTKTQSVQYDTSFSTATLETPRYGGSRNNFDGSVSLRMIKDSTIRAGVARAVANYEERIFASSAEDSQYVSFDRLTSRWFVLHTKYLHASRRGNGLDTSELVADGEQAGIRTFDIADRDRRLFTLVGSFLPTASGNVSIDVTAGAGKDNFPNSQFGVLNAKHYVYGIGVSATPVNKVSFGISYDLDDFNSLQWSRNTSSDPNSAAGKLQFADPTRNWSTTGHDRLNSVLANVELTKLGEEEKVDLRFTYNYNRGRTTYLYGLTADTTLAAPNQLPAIVNDLNRATLDASYMLTKRVGVGLTYWFERYRVNDFALDATGIPQINMPSTLLLGYQFLPYTAHTVFGHLIYHW